MTEQNNTLSIIPPFVFGTSALGNIYKVETYAHKKKIVEACISSSDGIAFFDSAGKYGAGLALEVLGSSLEELQVDPAKVIISNKLGWYRIPLAGVEPTFEPGIWKNLKFDAEQRISYSGILECFEQGNQLLGQYNSEFVSVHDPDEYLFAAVSESDYQLRYKNILEAYRALFELKAKGQVQSVGIGAKDWKTIRKISGDIDFDWIMIANSLTLISHPIDLIEFVAQMERQNIAVINSAIFNGGFLTGGNFYNYRLLNTEIDEDAKLINWRNDFYEICKQFEVEPSVACYQYSKNFSGIKSIAMSTTRPEKVAQNIAMANACVAEDFWVAMKKRGLI